MFVYTHLQPLVRDGVAEHEGELAAGRLPNLSGRYILLLLFWVGWGVCVWSLVFIVCVCVCVVWEIFGWWDGMIGRIGLVGLYMAAVCEGGEKHT